MTDKQRAPILPLCRDCGAHHTPEQPHRETYTTLGVKTECPACAAFFAERKLQRLATPSPSNGKQRSNQRKQARRNHDQTFLEQYSHEV